MFLRIFLSFLLLSSSCRFLMANDRPNIIVILLDDMGWSDSSTYGSEYYQTPNLTRLAATGVRFTNAYAASPLCSPTRASILTGQHPARLHMTVAITPKNVAEPKALQPEGNAYCGRVQNKNHLPLEVFTIAEVLKHVGYRTAHIGKWHLTNATMQSHNAERQGFDYVIGGQHLPGPPDYYSPYMRGNKSGTHKSGIRNLKPGPKGEYLNERLAEESIQWLETVKLSKEPFFLNLWHYAVHTPIIAKKDLMPKYKALRDPNSNQRCPEMATMLESMDNSVGILLDWLDRPENQSIKANTLILLTSDNGGLTHLEINGNTVTSNRPLRGGKANTYEGGVRVPWIVSWPSRIQKNHIIDTPVQSIDIYPTLLEILGVKMKIGQVIDGQSILPLLTGHEMEHQPIFTHFPHLMGILCAPSTSVRVGDWKLIRYYHAGINAKKHRHELFNLDSDPYEAIELSNYFPQKVTELDSLITKFLEDTQALIPQKNFKYRGNPGNSRIPNSKAVKRPKQFRLKEVAIKINQQGSRIIELFDESNQVINAQGLILKGNDWASLEHLRNGTIRLSWNKPTEGDFAKILLGWKGGSTCFEINDWTLPPVELTLSSDDGI